jgi:hypothetical protein
MGVRSYGGAVSRGYSSRGYYAGARGGAYYGGGAVPRGSGGGYRGASGAQYRHPRAGTGTGNHYGGYGYGHGYGHYGYGHGHGYYGHYGYPYYRGYYPYYPYYAGYYPYGYGLSVGLGFYYGSGYASAYYGAPAYAGATYVAPSYASSYPAPAVSYPVEGEPRNDYSEQGASGQATPEDAAELKLAILPPDASVWIDDEFRGPAQSLARLVLPPGRHRVEVVRPGFRTEVREVDLRPGALVSLRIELVRP